MLHGEGPASVVQLVVGTGTPSCPLSPRPQQYAAPAAVSAQLCAPPAVTDANAVTGTAAVTETVALPLFPSDVAVIVADPAATAATMPSAETVATAVALVDQVTERPASVAPA